MMQPRTVVLGLVATLAWFVGCEHDPAGPMAAPLRVEAPPPNLPAPAPPPTKAPAIVTTGASAQPATPTPAPRRVALAPGPLPTPPTIEPRGYAAWLRALTAGEQRQIARFCRRHRTDFQLTCGGIGPLHIPYPPYTRAPVYRRGKAPADPRSLFTSVDEWHASLSAAQRAYLARNCQGGEDLETSDLCGDNTPLVLAFNGEPVSFREGGAFAFQAGLPTATDWPTATTPWLALDRDHDGSIASGAELFGSDTMLADGRTAVHGFAALAALDHNHDGQIDAADPAFADLILWSDRDADQRSTAADLAPLAATVVSISLAYDLTPRCDPRGNCEGERSRFTWRDADGALHEGAVVDVYLPRR